MAGERIGQQIGNYTLTQLLGQGGFAEVYLGQHRRLPLQAAIKILLARVTDKVAQQFQQEARTIATLQHPHIIRILDFDVKDGLPFLVMEFASGGSLRQRHPRGELLPPPTMVAYVKQVAQALQYAHEHRFIHRDIKPENLLLDAMHRLVLSDFGIAIMHHTGSLDPRTVAGTAAYMAPEQLQGKPCAASDQYALGVTVYEWLAGRPPFQGSATEVAMQHVLTSPPSLRQYNPAISPDLERVVFTALEKDVSRRYARVTAFAEALEAVVPSSRATGGMASAKGSNPPPPFDIPTAAFSSPFSAPTSAYGMGDPRFHSSSSASTFSSRSSAGRLAQPSMSDEERADYDALCRQIQSRVMSFGGSLVVRAPGCPDGTVIKVVEQSFWSLSPQLMESFPRTKYAEIRRHPVGSGRFVSAAIFTELLPTQYVVWTADLMGTAIAYEREARVVSL